MLWWWIGLRNGQIKVLQGIERAMLTKEQERERERIRSLSFAYSSESAWEAHSRVDADFVTISLADSSANKRGDRSKSTGCREELERQQQKQKQEEQGWLGWLRRRGNSLFAAASPSAGWRHPHQQQQQHQHQHPVASGVRRDDIFEPEGSSPTRPPKEKHPEAAQQNEAKAHGEQRDEMGKGDGKGQDELANGAQGSPSTDAQSEEVIIASRIESLFEQAQQHFALGKRKLNAASAFCLL